ncbi:hypothetical protein MP638_002529 [Amoeboaphelidium occidentale]|nr:hypothetical protein MP638_002529 [Amoeboaphelidium occidentale]
MITIRHFNDIFLANNPVLTFRHFDEAFLFGMSAGRKFGIALRPQKTDINYATNTITRIIECYYVRNTEEITRIEAAATMDRSPNFLCRVVGKRKQNARASSWHWELVQMISVPLPPRPAIRRPIAPKPLVNLRQMRAASSYRINDAPLLSPASARRRISISNLTQ